MQVVRGVVVALLMTCVLASVSSGATKVYVAASQPPEVVLPESVKRVAVVEFTTKDATSYADIASSRLNSLLASAPDSRFEIIDRKHLKNVLAEQDLGASGVTDSSSAVKAGKLLNADAIIFGAVHVETSTDTVEKPKIGISGNMPSIGSSTKVRRSAVVNVTFNMVQPESGKVLATRSISRSYDSEKAGGKGLKKMLGGGAQPSTEQVVNDLIEQCVAEFAGKISAHADIYEFELASSKGTKAGTTFAEGGDYASAAKQYDAASKADPKDHAAAFDLAVMKLILNEPKAALESFDKAIGLKTDKKYIQARQQVGEVVKANSEVQFRVASSSEISQFKAAADTR